MPIPKKDKYGVPYSCLNGNCTTYSSRIYPVKLNNGTDTHWCNDCITRDIKRLRKVFTAKRQREKPKKKAKIIKGFTAPRILPRGIPREVSVGFRARRMDEVIAEVFDDDDDDIFDEDE